ncbi:MAG: helix-turn-helix transcriptional regulator, partial [Bacilli bacterium]|nr:helix-turn-helix transcriptional regulator [Bacilli bacterium]
MQKESLGRYIASVRKKKGKTQKDLADALAYTPQAISKFEIGDGSLPLDIVISVCEYLDISLDSLFLREEEPKPFDNSVKNLSGLGDKLKAIREDNRLSQDDWGNRLGISPKTIRKYEKDEQLPSFLAFEAYCEQKGVLPSAILLSQQGISAKPIKKKPTRLVIISAIAAAVAVSAGVGIPLGVYLANKPSSSYEPGVSSSINEPSTSSQGEEEPTSIESSSESVEQTTSETISSSSMDESPSEDSSESSLEESSPEGIS